MGIKSTKGLAWIPFQAALKHNHEYEALLAKASELGWEYQEVCGQVAIIEKDWAATLARGSEIPAHLRPQVFDVSAVAGSEALAEVA